MTTSSRLGNVPRSRIDPALAYPKRRGDDPDLLRLDGNEGAALWRASFAVLAEDPEVMRRYPDAAALEATLARRFRVGPERVIVTAGADEVIDRACRAYLATDRVLLAPDPTFEMLDRYAALAGGMVDRVPWPTGEFPVAQFVARIEPRTGIVAVVSPNNPTGAVATLDQVRRVACASSATLVLLDHVYVEYADVDLTDSLLDLPNVLVVRTLSKAWGLAGCRVGYAIGAPGVVSVLRAAGGPYSVAGPSLLLAQRLLEEGGGALAEHVARIRVERAALTSTLASLGLPPLPSQANFVLVECGSPRSAVTVWSGLRDRGIVVRDFPHRAGLESRLRISLPGAVEGFARLCDALRVIRSRDSECRA